MEQNKQTTELGTKKIWNLLLQYAIPSVIAMTAASLYNITDSIFIGQGVGALAISGLAITFPLMILAAAFGAMVGVGASTLMSLRLGQKDYVTANKILGNVFVLNCILGVLYTIIVLIFLDPILRFFGAGNQTLPYAYDYMFVITLGNLITHMYMGLNALLRATGHPRKSMYATITTVVINAILTPIFIYILKLGIQGAALATIISQLIMLIWQIKFFSNKEHIVHLQKGTFRLVKKIVTDSLAIGLSPFLMNSAMCIIVIVVNHSLLKYGGSLAVGAYGIVNRVAMLFTMVVIGINQGMQPIVGYNYGAQQFNRVNDTLKYTIILASGVMILGFLICEIFPHSVSAIFTNDKELTAFVVEGLKIVMIFFPIVGFQIVTSNFFQSIGMAKKAIFMSLTRQVLFLLPCILFFPSIWGLKGVWYSMPASDLLSSIIAAILLVRQYKTSKKQLSLNKG